VFKLDELCSHPGIVLEEHLIGVNKWGKHFINQSPGRLYSMLGDGLITEMLLFHDIGKSTLYFQKYLKKEKVDKKLKAHSLLSAILFAWYELETGNISNLDLLAAFGAILYHHTDLKSVEAAAEAIIDEEEILERQWNSIDKGKLYNVLSCCQLNEEILKKLISLEMRDIFAKVEEFLYTASDEWSQYRRSNTAQGEENINLEYYYKMQMLYSILLDSDKSHLVLKNTDFVRRNDLSVDVRTFMESKGIGSKSTFLNEMRKEAFEEVAQKLCKINLDKNRIMLLTLPTGMGKTLTSLNFVFELRKKLKEKTGITYRIVYALPFLSIIDQNAKVIENILSNSNDDPNVLIKHHHLQPYEFQDDEHNEYKPPDFAEIFIEGWNGEIIVTTFVQLFETLIGYLNRRQRKFNKLNNCIIIVDEIQAVPVQYYFLIRKTILEYVKYCNSYFIAMTATQPAIFQIGEAIPLINSKKYFKNLNRIKLISKISNPMTIDEFADSVVIEEGKRYLFILNTIGSARQLFKAMKKRHPEKRICFLSTGVVPVERLQRIEAIRNKKYDIVVSTQLIEAGVDVDFDVVYRDIAPMPSIIQSAGRANREGLSNGKVIAVMLVDDKRKTYASYVYKAQKSKNGRSSRKQENYGNRADASNIDLQQTIRILGSKEEYNEKELNDLVNTYYSQICGEGFRSMDVSREILKGMGRCIFDKCDLCDIRPVSDFRLIDEDIEKLPVFIELDSHAEKLWKEYTELLLYKQEDEEGEENKWEKRSKVMNKIKEMAPYTVNVSINTLSKANKPPEVNGFLYVQKAVIKNYYDKEMGFGSDSSLCF